MGPFDPSILGKVPLQGLPSFRESYRFGVTLRDLADRRRNQELQYQTNQLALQERQRDLQEQEMFRTALRQGVSLPDLVKISPKYGLAYSKSVFDQQTSQLNQLKAVSDLATANLTRGEKERTAQTEKEKTLADVLFGIRNIQDPAQRQARMDELAMTDLMKPEAQRLGTGSMLGQLQREGEPTPLAEPEFQRRYSVAYTPKETQSLLSAEAKAAQEKKEKDIEIAKKQLDEAIRTAPIAPVPQAEWAEWVKKLPADVARRMPPIYSSAAVGFVRRMGLTAEQAINVDKLDSPGKIIDYMNRPDATPEDKARGQAMLEQSAGYAEAARAEPRSRLLTPAEEAQQIRIAGARAAAGAEARPPTEGERKVLGFYERMKDATQVVEQLEQTLNKMGPLEQLRLKNAPNFAQTETGQLYWQALRQFTEARLRKESGAVIGPAEFEYSERTFFPQPGDSKAVLQRKKAARELLVNSMRRESGRAYTQTYGEGEPPAAPSAVPTGVPKVGETFNGKKITKVTKVK